MTEKQENIIKVALELFAKEGYSAVSTGMIAKQAGVSEGLIFRHFTNKEGLLKAILDLGAQQAQKHFATIIFEADPKEVIRKAIEIPTTIKEEEQNYWRLLYALKWQQGSYDDAMIEPLKTALVNAFSKLGYDFPKEEAELLMLFFNGAATQILLHNGEGIESTIHLLKSKYKV
jgi:AcrR family transcriptional regulator